MAKLLAELTEQVLSCGNCLVPFSEGPKEARLLPCRHCFCLECLQQLCQGNQLTCPKCQNVTEVPGSVETSFPKEVGLMNVIEYLHFKKRNKAITCGECQQESCATHRCQTCHSFLCPQCVQNHQCLKYLRNHSLVPVEDLLQSLEAYFSEPELCPKHEGARLDLHCSSPDCCTVVCSNCAITSHKGDKHQLEDLADVVQREKGDNQELCAQLQERRAQLGKLEEEVSSAKSSTLAQKEEILGALGETFDTIVHAFTSRRQQIERKVEEASAAQVSRHDGNMAALGYSVAEVEVIAGYLARIAASAQPVQFLALHRAQTSSVRQLLASPACPPSLDLRPRTLKLDTTGLQQFITIFEAFSDVINTTDTNAQTAIDVSETPHVMDDVIHTCNVAIQAFERDDVSTQTPQVMTQSTGTDTLRTPTADFILQTETVGLRETGSQTETSTEIEFPDFALCGDCLNTGECHLEGEVLVNQPGRSTTQSNTPHTHPVYPSHHSHSPSLSPLFPPSPSPSTPYPSSASVSPPLPQFRRLKNFYGTLGRMVLETGLHHWEVTASFQGKWGSDWWLMEAGVVTLGEQNESCFVVGASQSAWGVEVRDCFEHQSLCVCGWERLVQVCHTQVMPLPTPSSPLQIRVGFLLHVEACTLVCLDAVRGVRLCTLHNLRPPLCPCFAVLPKSVFPVCEVRVRVETGDRTAVDRGLLEQLRRETEDSGRK